MTLFCNNAILSSNIKLRKIYYIFSPIAFFVIALIMLNVNSVNSQAATVWTESWDSYEGMLFRWNGVGDAGSGYNPRCFQVIPGLLDMNCQSGALISLQKFDYRSPVAMEGSVYAEPSVNSTTTENLSHFTIYGVDDADGARYSGIYISYKDGVDKVFIIGGGYSQQVATVPHGVHKARVVWEQTCTGRFLRKCSWGYSHYLDGEFLKRTTSGLLKEPASAWVGCSSVGPGAPNDGSSSHCQFGPVTIQGTMINNITPTPTLTPTLTPTPTKSPTPTPTPTPTTAPCRWFFCR